MHGLVTRASYFRRRCARRRAVHKTDLYGLTRRLAEAKPTAPTDLERSPWFPMQTRPRRTQCGVGADDSFVTNAECARARIPVAPLPQTNHGAHLAGASSRFLCLSFFAAAKKVSAAPHRGNANRPLTKQGKAPAPGTLTNKRRAGKKPNQRLRRPKNLKPKASYKRRSQPQPDNQSPSKKPHTPAQADSPQNTPETPY
ncbi:hypothetical protein R69746_03404 [Paraburkholderia aspalathi]|nr:hypothetical protein R69746_03404 [Paraburkholderia aspalathi]